MKKLILILTMALMSAAAHAGISFIDGSSTVLGPMAEAHCLQGLSCTVAQGRVQMSVGQQTETSGTSTTMTAYQCGQTYISSGSATITLPLAADAIGCRYTFIVNASASMDIKPNIADQIQVLTNAAGDRIRSATVGNSVVLQALAAGSWIAVGKEQGTWSDVN